MSKKKPQHITFHIDCKIYMDTPKTGDDLKKQLSDYLIEIIRQAEIETR